MPDPTATYIDIAYKIDQEYEYPQAEAQIDFQRLFYALGSMIKTNSNLEAQLASNQKLLEEKDIEIFGKDMEIFSLSDPSTRLQPKEAND